MPLESIYKNNGLIQLDRYTTSPSDAEELTQALREKWALLRELQYAGDFPVEIVRKASESPTNEVEVVALFRWQSTLDRERANADTKVQRLNSEISVKAKSTLYGEDFTQAVRGFNVNFPNVGGMELLNGVCACTLTIPGVIHEFPMSVKNGIVLMHRSPGQDFDGDGRREMYIKIVMHGGELTAEGLGAFRVEQNHNRPNDGIVRSMAATDSDSFDFPAVAIWRVHWKILTAMGELHTDPSTPLVFGPAIVTHYPPVGTEFFASTGPVALLHAETGERVGTLTPRRLTAFDIVVTRDDVIYSDILNPPPPDIFPLFNDAIAEAERTGPPREAYADSDDDVLR